MPTKIIHISDLHFCDKEIAIQVQNFFKILKKIDKFIITKFNLPNELIPAETKFEFTDNYDVLIKSIKEHSPEIIIISGDLTSFGDKKSFDLAKSFINELSNNGETKVICSPGNHDVLAPYLFDIYQNLVEKINLFANNNKFKFFLIKLFFKDFFKAILELKNIFEDFKKDQRIALNPNDSLYHFNQSMSSDNGSFGTNESFINKDVIIEPYNTVSKNPLFMNLGVSSLDENLVVKVKKRKIIAQGSDLSDKVKILFFHHNPISSPDVNEGFLSYAYNSMPTSSSFLKMWQENGVDIVLFGHQHERTITSMDFLDNMPGNFYLIGAPSATLGNNRGYNIISVNSRYHATLQEVNYVSTQGYYKLGKEINFTFEDECITDDLTLKTQKEIRSSIFKTDEGEIIWRDIFNGISTGEFYFLGPRQKDLYEHGVSFLKELLEQPKDRIKNLLIKILVNDPNIYRELSMCKCNVIDKLKTIMSNSPDIKWEDQADINNNLLIKLIELYNCLSSDQKEKIKVKLSHTLLPIGVRAHANDQNNVKDFILLRLLPVGVDKSDSELGTLKINKRSDEALYNYYRNYIDKLWDRAKPFNLEYKSV